MKVVILCGGQGTRLREETEYRPKPMVPIGGRPMLWHIMKYYAHFGHKQFILCLGYKGEFIKDYFRNYHWNTSDVTLKLGSNPEIHYHTSHDEDDWEVTLLDTGEETMTGGRLRRSLEYVGDETFMLTYGDGLSNVDLHALVKSHHDANVTATLTAVQPAGRFGELGLDGNLITGFSEKPESDTSPVNGGFFVMEPEIGEVLESDSTILEREPLELLAGDRKLAAYSHTGFWQCMDTFREQQMLESLWAKDAAPWKLWDEPV
ncbi:MAG: glucose-1-phosphate cytidylyltransferase [Verrucomicrobiales bacterium]|nr:glucose-1-phosphate cytidylyltransferase [Verrucomicrobiales bacterium]